MFDILWLCVSYNHNNSWTDDQQTLQRTEKTLSQLLIVIGIVTIFWTCSVIRPIKLIYSIFRHYIIPGTCLFLDRRSVLIYQLRFLYIYIYIYIYTRVPIVASLTTFRRRFLYNPLNYYILFYKIFPCGLLRLFQNSFEGVFREFFGVFKGSPWSDVFKNCVEMLYWT